MDRRLFLTGILGAVGAATVAVAMRPNEAFAGVPAARGGILDELEKAEPAVFDGEDAAEVELVDHRRGHRRHWERRHWERRHGHHRPRRPGWRRVCRRYWRRGRVHVRCWRERGWGPRW